MHCHRRESGGEVRPVCEEQDAEHGGPVSGLADAKLQQRPDGQPSVGNVDDAGGREQGSAEASGFCSDMQTGPVNGFWADADWLGCRDAKWRPVSPKPQPLADGSSESLGRVRPEIIAKIEEEISESTMESEGIRDQALRDLLISFGSQAKHCWSAGRLPGLHEAPFLLAFLRQLKKQGWGVAQCIPISCKEVVEARMRGLRSNEEQAGAPCQHGLEGQQHRERADAVSFLSSLLARHASEAWGEAYEAHAETGFPLAHGCRSRAGRLKGYGNAINAEAARVFIESVMEVSA